MMLLQLSMTTAEGSTINLDIDILVGVPKPKLCSPVFFLMVIKNFSPLIRVLSDAGDDFYDTSDFRI